MFSFLKRYNDLEECLLLKFESDFYNMDVRLYFEYIWTDDFSHVRVEDDKKFLIITLHNVKIFNMSSHITDFQIENKEQVGWGLTEIAGARIIENSELIQNITDSVLPYIHLQIAYEGKNEQIDIVFTSYTYKECKTLAASL